MAINKKVSLRNAILNVVDDSSPDFLSIYPTLIKWAKEADQRIGTYYQYERKIGVLTIDNCTAALPESAVKVEGLVIGDLGENIMSVFGNVIVNKTIIDDYIRGAYYEEYVFWTGYNDYSNFVNWEIQNNEIVFQNDLDGQNVTIEYLSYITDVDGLPLVNESHLDAISSFVQLKLAKRERWSRYRQGKMNNADLAMVKTMESDWHRAVRQARANDGESLPHEKTEIASYVNDPISGKGNYLLENLKY